MHIPNHFSVSDKNIIDEFIHNNAFGQIISIAQGIPVATHLAFMYRPEENKLLAHIGRGNPQWQNLEGQKVLLILNGPHGYISPTWYDNAGVPTWDYQTVHIYGTARCTEYPSVLKELVEELSSVYESGSENPWQADYKPSMLRGIIGIEICIEDIQCQFKLSQNQTPQEQQNVSEKLHAEGNIDLANAIPFLP
jgi:transcriptional regulator